ncbi:MAG: hypothetical protein J1E16_01075 [Muribaculaceae bacterium]|nr:hypothetical protein [Muribaculaceae bacterium]
MIKRASFLISITLISLLISCGDKTEEKVDKAEEVQTEEQFTQSNVEKTNLPPVYGVRSIPVRNIGPLSQVFNDSNLLQLDAARRLGIEPISDLGSAYFMKRPIVKVNSNQYYKIDSLRHSIPYLVPEAAILLDEIGKNFIDSLHNRGGDSYKIKVTSLLRTPESVGRLRRVNINATDSSTHQYATTFDISYVNFYCMDENRQINQGDLKNLLAEVLQDLRQQGKCLVKFERKTGCFHVTVNH